MKISIAMATYNGARYLQEQLDSFMGQTRLPDELVVCDDRSIDGTVLTLERFQKQSPFPVWICRNGENLGFARNFGKAIGLCKGDIIFLSDQDDVWFPEKIATVEKVITSSPDRLFVINDLEIANCELTPTGFTVIGQNRSLGGEEEYYNFGCGMAFRANLKSLILPIPSQANSHDGWINTIVLAIGARCLLGKALQFYRRHESNVSNWIGSSTARIPLIDRLGLRQVQTLPSGYTCRRDLLGILMQRLIDIGPEKYIELGAVRPFSEAIAKLESEREALSLRLTLLESGWMRRKWIAIGMVLNREYGHFCGWKSFAKDMFR
jgi:glycosyltransferase involved in cell wall biosynthesis